MRPLLATLLALAAAAPAAALGGVAVTAVGPVHHTIDYFADPATSCDGSGAAAVAVDLATGRLALATADSDCAPGYSILLSGCAEAADGSVSCSRDSASSRIRLALAPDGAFEFSWSAADFYETITGTLVRSP